MSVIADWEEKKTEKEIENEKKEADFEAEKEKERIKALNKKKEEMKQEEERLRNEIKKRKEDINKRKISINGDFFPAARPERRTKSENKLKKYFNDNAFAVCAATGNFDILEQKIIVVELGEVSAFPKKGLTAGIQLGIRGLVECKQQNPIPLIKKYNHVIVQILNNKRKIKDKLYNLYLTKCQKNFLKMN